MKVGIEENNEKDEEGFFVFFVVTATGVERKQRDNENICFFLNKNKIKKVVKNLFASKKKNIEPTDLRIFYVKI